MNSSNNTPTDWFYALSTVHYLSAAQLETYFQVSPGDALRHPDVLWYRDALWLKSAFGGGRHLAHRRLCAEVYCRLQPWPVIWGSPRAEAGPMPDAVLSFGEHTIYFEADTGKETHRQWETKLTQYQRLSAGALWVVAEGGRLRLTRLQAWLAEAHLAIGWQLTAVDSVRQVPPSLIELPARPVDLRGASTAPASRETVFRLDGEPWNPEAVRDLVDRRLARPQGRELVHGQLICHFTRNPRRIWARWVQTRYRS